MIVGGLSGIIRKIAFWQYIFDFFFFTVRDIMFQKIFRIHLTERKKKKTSTARNKIQ